MFLLVVVNEAEVWQELSFCFYGCVTYGVCIYRLYLQQQTGSSKPLFGNSVGMSPGSGLFKR